MNGLLTLLGIESWKPVATALVMPPIPLFLLLLIGARLILPRRGLGWFVILLSLAGLWLSACAGIGQMLTRFALKPPAPYSIDAIASLKQAVKDKQPVAIVVLGGGAEPLAPEYGISNLSPLSLERLRYGLWLSRETGAPVAFSGGVGWIQPSDAQAPEAQIAARIAAKEFGQPLKWVEERSRDTRENAGYTLQQLKPDGITRIVLVTHGWHMPRAQKMFEQAAGSGVRIEPAPMGLAQRATRPVLDWIPTPHGYQKVQHALRELLALLVRA
jgi:uncharacterized SAM-binding protein YcdF (DUF218 family)